MAEIKYSYESQKDLIEIKSYIENDLKSPASAERVLKRIALKIRLLETMPQIGTPLSSVIDIDTDYRFIKAGNYLCFYRFIENDTTCYIDRVLYKRCDYVSILFDSTQEIASTENDD